MKCRRLPAAFRALAALCCLGLAPMAAALDPAKSFQHYVKDAWSIEQGLPQITVMAVTQDAEGYVWAGTQAGLARFDGVRFETFHPDNTPQLPGMFTQALFTDRDGTMWVGTYKGLARYAQRRFTTLTVAGGEAAAGLDVRALAQGADGRVYAGGPDGLFVVQGEVLVRVDGMPPAPVFALAAQGNALWTGGPGGVHRVERGEARYLAFDAGDAPIAANELAVAQDRLYVGTNRGLYVLRDQHLQRFAPERIGEVPIEALYEDGDGNLWVSATDALLRVREGRVVERIPDSSTAAHRAARTLFEDREGNLWIGSQWEGLARYWNGWTRRYSIDEGLQDPIVWSVAPDPDGGTWVGGNDGVSHLQRGAFEPVLDGAALPHPNAYTLLAEPDVLWIGTRGGLTTLRGGQVERPPAFAPLDNTQINGLLRDRHGVLWLATLSGLYRYEGDTLTRWGEERGLEDPRVRLLFETSDGRLLVGTQDGLYERIDDTLARVGENAGMPPHQDITAIHELPGGELLVGSLRERLYLYADKRWFEFTTAHGLPANSAFFLTSDSFGWVWVAGIRGVYRVPLEELHRVRDGSLAAVTKAQMLLSERGDQRGSQKGYCCNGAGNAKGFLRGDRLWLPTRGGVVTLGSEGVTFNRVPPPVVIERIKHGGHWQALAGLAPLTLPEGQRDVAFEFTALSFQQPASVAFQYRLAGYEDAWHDVVDATRRDATYTNLSAGDYRFEVRAANNAGVWNEHATVLPVSVPPYFHETRAFIALMVAAALALAALGHRLTTRGLRRRQLALQAQIAERTRDLAAANRQLEEMSHTDVLTGLRNRRYLQAQLPADLSFYLREVRKPGNEGSIVMLALADIDHFKQVNDRHGHRAGDLVLQQIARLLEHQVRSGDYVVRWGGEEFLLVFRPMPGNEADKIAERIRRAVALHPFDIGDGMPIHLTTSIGFVEYPLFRDPVGSHPAWDRMVELADRALYAVKHDGRNGWATYRPSYPMRMEDLLAELDHAKAGGKLPEGVRLHRSERKP